MEAASQAADQMVRLTLEGVEYAIRLTGKTAVHAAALAAALGKLAAEKHTSKGAQRLAAMLKSGRELTVFSVPEQRLKEFAQEAKRYGVTYCALRDSKVQDGVVDLLVRAEDAPKINRIVERYGIVRPEQELPQNPSRDRVPSTPGQEKQCREDTSQGRHFSHGSENSDERPSLIERLVEIAQQQHQTKEPRHRVRDRGER